MWNTHLQFVSNNYKGGNDNWYITISYQEIIKRDTIKTKKNLTIFAICVLFDERIMTFEYFH